MANTDEQSSSNPFVKPHEEKRLCYKCKFPIAPVFLCRCGGGGGGDEGGSGNEETKSDKLQKETDRRVENPIQENSFAPNVVSEKTELSIEKLWLLLTMEFDPRGSFTLRAKPGASANELKQLQKLFDAIEKEFDQLRDEVEKQGLPTSNFRFDRDANGITAFLPPTHYKTLLQRLVEKSLLPRTVLKEVENILETSQANLSPFHTKPTPPGYY